MLLQKLKTHSFATLTTCVFFVVGSFFAYQAYNEIVVFPSWPEYSATVTYTASRRVEYQYMIQGKLYKAVQPKDQFSNVFFNYREVIPVYVNPKNPQDSYIEMSPTTNILFSAFFFVFGFLFFQYAVLRKPANQAIAQIESFLGNFGKRAGK
jgi:hypothetical protein